MSQYSESGFEESPVPTMSSGFADDNGESERTRSGRSKDNDDSQHAYYKRSSKRYDNADKPRSRNHHLHPRVKVRRQQGAHLDSDANRSSQRSHSYPEVLLPDRNAIVHPVPNPPIRVERPRSRLSNIIDEPILALPKSLGPKHRRTLLKDVLPLENQNPSSHNGEIQNTDHSLQLPSVISDDSVAFSSDQLSIDQCELPIEQTGARVTDWVNNQPERITDVGYYRYHTSSFDESLPHEVQARSDAPDIREIDAAGQNNKAILTVCQAQRAFELTELTSEDEQAEKRSDDPINDVCYVVASKWLTSIVGTFTILGCFAFNKICLLTIGKAYSTVTNTTNKTLPIFSDKKGYKESIVVMLVIILMIPQGFSLFIGILSAKPRQPWPKRSAVKWIIIGGIVESFCLCFLCIYAVTVLGNAPHLFLLFVSGLFVVPTIIQVYESAWMFRATKWSSALFVAAIVLQFAGVVLLYMMHGTTSSRDLFGISLAIIFLSLAWSSKARRAQTRSKKERNAYPICRHSYRYTTVSAREKAALLISLVHLIATPLSSIIVCNVFQVGDLDYVGEGFGLINSRHPVFYFFIGQIFLTLFGYHAAWLACSIYTHPGVLAIPTVLATPLALVFIEVESICNNMPFIPLACGPKEGPDLYYLIGACVLLLLGQFLSTECYMLVFKTRKKRHVFWMQYYTGAFLEPFILLNKRRRYKV